MTSFWWLTNKYSEGTNLLTLSLSNKVDDIDQSTTNLITTESPAN